jgi:hypothetical protein
MGILAQGTRPPGEFASFDSELGKPADLENKGFGKRRRRFIGQGVTSMSPGLSSLPNSEPNPLRDPIVQSFAQNLRYKGIFRIHLDGVRCQRRAMVRVAMDADRALNDFTPRPSQYLSRVYSNTQTLESESSNMVTRDCSFVFARSSFRSSKSYGKSSQQGFRVSN